MNKGKMAGIVALTMVLVCVVGVQQGYAAKSEIPVSTISGLIESVSNPTGDCLNLGLKGWYGTVTISLNRLWTYLRNANPNSTYIVWVGYVQAGGTCNGTWRPVGSVSTDGVGEGSSVEWFKPSGTYSYFVLELKDNAGIVIYGTHALSP
jgi:hypothetical protein